MSENGINRPRTGISAVGAENVEAHVELEKQKKKINKEIIDKVFDSLLSSSFLVFLVVILIVFSGFYIMTTERFGKNDVLDFWKMILPLVTTYIGYAIGRGAHRA
ncbi:hypothetical protein [Salinisphaera japonica]|uniref:hypothetical protein n=1 Tax=Salinisphaera japonica TaxID=1304270 RepID=UPI000F4B83C9|nr:hypothetical protein [Salinisphaera japonica]